MYNKIKFTSLAIAVTLCSCSDANDNNTPATDLSVAIDKAIEKGELEEAKLLCDSLNSVYPDSIELRRKTINQRASIAQAECLRDIPSVDARIVELQTRIDSLMSDFREVRVSAATGSYLLYKTLSPNEVSGNNVAAQARVGNDDTPWMIILRIPAKLNAQNVKLIAPNGTSLVSVEAPQSTKFDSDSYQTLVLGPEQGKLIAEAIEKNGIDNGYKLQVNNNELSISLSKSSVTAIARSCNMATARAEMRQALIDREALERRLSTARNQLANTAQ